MANHSRQSKMKEQSFMTCLDKNNKDSKEIFWNSDFKNL